MNLIEQAIIRINVQTGRCYRRDSRDIFSDACCTATCIQQSHAAKNVISRAQADQRSERCALWRIIKVQEPTQAPFCSLYKPCCLLVISEYGHVAEDYVCSSKLSVTHTLGQKTFLKSIQKHTSAHTEIAIVVVHECANSECTKSNMNTKFKSGHSWDKPEIFKCCLSEESF